MRTRIETRDRDKYHVRVHPTSQERKCWAVVVENGHGSIVHMEGTKTGVCWSLEDANNRAKELECEWSCSKQG